MSICRVSILWQRAPPLLPRRWRSSHLFWYRSAGDSGECAKEGKTYVHRCWMFINCCSSELWLGYGHKPCLCSNENKCPDIWEKSPVNEKGNVWEGFDPLTITWGGERPPVRACLRWVSEWESLCAAECFVTSDIIGRRGFEKARISRFGALWCSCWL